MKCVLVEELNMKLKSIKTTIVKKLLFFILIFVFGLQCAIAQSGNRTETITTGQTNTQKVKVFPNPATNVVNILGLKNSNRAVILIMDTYGNIVLEHHWEIKNKALNLSVSSLHSGIYIVTIRSEEQQVQTKFYKK